MRVAIAVERDLDPVEPVRVEAIHDVTCQKEAVGDDVDQLTNATLLAERRAALRQVIHDGQVEQRLAAKESQDELLRLDFIQPVLDPSRDAARLLHRHLRGELVVVAVVTLEAVVAREVALQRGKHGHAQLVGVLAHVGEVLRQRLLLAVSTVDDEAVLDQRVDRLALVGIERALARLDPVQ